MDIWITYNSTCFKDKFNTREVHYLTDVDYMEYMTPLDMILNMALEVL